MDLIAFPIIAKGKRRGGRILQSPGEADIFTQVS
jgi:hypothetical protein